MAGKIYTKTGDDGTTGLFGGQRVEKYSQRVEVYGTIDELNAYIGLLFVKIKDQELGQSLKKLNNLLFIAGTDLATPIDKKQKIKIDRINAEDITWLEEKIDEYTLRLPEIKYFILSGGTETAALLHIARTICRRVERQMVLLASNENLGEWVIRFFNRLSDFLFIAARYADFIAGAEEVKWTGR
jgi:cob(I)alamin adenosyltransferase